MAIPFALGFVHALYPGYVLARAAGLRRDRVSPRHALARETRERQRTPPYVLVAALALVAWPPLMRPLLDGDSLSYHLPNAAAWVHAHGLWTTDPRYWWYPPGSELFASGLFAVSGPFALGWSGLGALALLGFRIVDWARAEFDAPAWLADALAAATVTDRAAGAASRNAAKRRLAGGVFPRSAVDAAARPPAASARTVAMTVLLKPYGWIFAAVAAVDVEGAAESVARRRGRDRAVARARCAVVARLPSSLRRARRRAIRGSRRSSRTAYRRWRCWPASRRAHRRSRCWRCSPR